MLQNTFWIDRGMSTASEHHNIHHSSNSCERFSVSERGRVANSSAPAKPKRDRAANSSVPTSPNRDRALNSSAQRSRSGLERPIFSARAKPKGLDWSISNVPAKPIGLERPLRTSQRGRAGSKSEMSAGVVFSRAPTKRSGPQRSRKGPERPIRASQQCRSAIEQPRSRKRRQVRCFRARPSHLSRTKTWSIGSSDLERVWCLRTRPSQLSRTKPWSIQRAERPLRKF